MSEAQRRALEVLRKFAENTIKTDSRDIEDWKEDMAFIEKFAKEQLAALAEQASGASAPQGDQREAMQLALDAITRRYEYVEAANILRAALASAPALASGKAQQAAEPAPEGCTLGDARVLRTANHALAQESHELQEALVDLYGQVKRFCEVEGEADFETGRTLYLLSRVRPLEFNWPFTTPPTGMEHFEVQPDGTVTAADPTDRGIGVLATPPETPAAQQVSEALEEARQMILSEPTVMDGWITKQDAAQHVSDAIAAFTTHPVPVAAQQAVGSEPRNPNSGHGHVFPRPDGLKAKCGGPAICKECARDAAHPPSDQASEKGEAQIIGSGDINQLLSALHAPHLEPSSTTVQTGTERITTLENELFRLGRMSEAPCFCCGYNGPGYFQPASHSCAARHHALFHGNGE